MKRGKRVDRNTYKVPSLPSSFFTTFGTVGVLTGVVEAEVVGVAGEVVTVGA